MSYETILAKIKSEIEEITDIGVVHDYQRYSKDWTTFLSLYRPNGETYIRGWDITRNATAEIYDDVNTTSRRTYSFLIRGWAQLDDSNTSEKTFQGLLEDICDKFRGQLKLDNTANLAGAVQIILVEQRQLGSVLCHYAEMTLEIMETKTYT